MAKGDPRCGQTCTDGNPCSYQLGHSTSGHRSRERSRKSQKNAIELRKAAGICARCAQPAREGSIHCEAHLESNRIRANEWLAKPLNRFRKQLGGQIWYGNKANERDEQRLRELQNG